MKSRLMIACLVFLSACASGSSDKRAAETASVRAQAADSLPTQTMAPGTCALFMWTRDEPRRFVLFYPAGAATAEAIVNGRHVRLAVDSQGGDVFAQFMTQMTFHGPDGGPVSLTMQPGDQIDGGRRVPVARMISQDQQGWEIITPLAGLTACQPE